MQAEGEVSRDGRIYAPGVFERAAKELNEKIENGQLVIGQIGFPKDGETRPKDASHQITEVKAKDGKIMATLKILDTEAGSRLLEMLRVGNVGLSARGVATLDDLEIGSFDAVIGNYEEPDVITLLGDLADREEEDERD